MGDDTTTIEVSIETYQRLNSRKLPSESFDDVAWRVLEYADELEALQERYDMNSEDTDD